MRYFILFTIILLAAHYGHCRKYRDISIISANSRYRPEWSTINQFQNTVAHSIEIALKNCQQQFQWDRWNCPTADFHSKRVSTLLDRETAFVHSISIAALIYTVAKNCSRGEIHGCGCNNFREITASGSIKISDCQEQMDFSVMIANKLLEQKHPERMDAQSYAMVHNRRVGEIAVRNSLRKHCRCHGTSGACTMQTCWLTLNSFSEIASELRKMYDRSINVSYNNKGEIDTNIPQDAIVFVLNSPNYCEKNAIANWKGTSGRLCSRSKTKGTSSYERKSCKNLCRACGLKVRKRPIVIKNRCKCKFNWCCDVICEVCEEHANEYFCK